MKFVFGDLDAGDEESRPAEQELKALKRVREIRHPYILSLERYDIIEGQLMIVMELADRNLWDRFRECRSQGLAGVPRDVNSSVTWKEAAEALDLNRITTTKFSTWISSRKICSSYSTTSRSATSQACQAPGRRQGHGHGRGHSGLHDQCLKHSRVTSSRFSDQYSLAIVFQELLTGTRPFNGPNTRQLIDAAH